MAHESDDIDLSVSSVNQCGVNSLRHDKKITRQSSPVKQLQECQLCFHEMESKQFQPCGHTTCDTCMDKLFKDRKVCPWDRMEVLEIVDIIM